MLETNDTLNAARVTLIQAGRTQDAVLPEFLRAFTQERTFHNLSAGLGDDNAKAVVAGIGQAALASAPDLNAGDLAGVVTQTLARLSKQDLASLAKNDSAALGRVQSIVQEEIKAHRSNPVPFNQHGTSVNVASNIGELPNGVLGNVRDGGRRFSDMKEKSSDAAGFAREIGAKPGDASLFTGTSAHVRQAIRSFLSEGTAISENDIRTNADAKTVIGLIRIGKIKVDDPRVPDSVRKIYDQMRKDGIDPEKAKAEEINKWFDANPAALEKAKATNALDEKVAPALSGSVLESKVQETQKTAASVTNQKILIPTTKM